MARKPTLSDRFMSEKISYGGEIRTRASVAKEMKEEGFPQKAIDRFAFGTPTIEEDRKNRPQMFGDTHKPAKKQYYGKHGDARPNKKTTYGYKRGRVNEYHVETVARQGRYTYLNANAYGQSGVRSAKLTGGTMARGRAYKNVVYNRTRGHYVGKNRVK